MENEEGDLGDTALGGLTANCFLLLCNGRNGKEIMVCCSTMLYNYAC